MRVNLPSSFVGMGQHIHHHLFHNRNQPKLTVKLVLGACSLNQPYEWDVAVGPVREPLVRAIQALPARPRLSKERARHYY